MALTAEARDIEEAEDVGYYYAYQGGLQLTEATNSAERPVGFCSLLAACSKHGLVFWSDLQGEQHEPGLQLRLRSTRLQSLLLYCSGSYALCTANNVCGCIHDAASHILAVQFLSFRMFRHLRYQLQQAADPALKGGWRRNVSSTSTHMYTCMHEDKCK